MTTKAKLTLISVLSAIGAVISIFQTQQFHQTRSGLAGFHSFCNIGQAFDCIAIEISPYADIMGFPLSGIAIAGYLVILGLSLFARSDSYRGRSQKVLQGFCSLAMVFTVAYLFIMVGVIGKLCLLCLAVDTINTLMVILAFRLPKDDGTAKGQMSLGLVGGVGAAAVVGALLFSAGTNPQAEMKKSDLNDMVESVMNAPVKEIPIPADAPVVGNPNAKITIVKFSDYECPACRLGANAIHPLFKRYPNEVKFVFVNFPLDNACNPVVPRRMHEFACEAAYVAVCAQEQGKFIEAYEILFENQSKLKTGEIADLLASVPGIDMSRLKTCVTQPSTVERVKRDSNLGKAVQIGATPTFFINGKRVEGGLPTNLWMEVIDKMLKQ